MASLFRLAIDDTLHVAAPSHERDDPWMRSLDIAVALAALIAAFPLLTLVAAAVAITSFGPVLFWHPRIGRGELRFGCLKFRTMVIDAEARLQDILAINPAARTEWQRDHKLRNDPRITLIDRFLRKSSLDGLLQLFNETGMVGPRPIVRRSAHFTAAPSSAIAVLSPASPACGRSVVATIRSIDVASRWMFSMRGERILVSTSASSS